MLRNAESGAILQASYMLVKPSRLGEIMDEGQATTSWVLLRSLTAATQPIVTRIQGRIVLVAVVHCDISYLAAEVALRRWQRPGSRPTMLVVSSF